MCGTVYECVHKTSRVHYAVKIIDTRKFTMSPGLSSEEIREEAEMMRGLDHPNIIRIKDTYETESWIFIVMEYVRGGDLFDRIIERGRYSEVNTRSAMIQILDAVQYLHSKDICHRDLKPENILLVSKESDCELKITDFGLAKRTNQEGLKTFCGTPQYFAPEVLKRRGDSVSGSSRYGMKADMWSLGVVLYILLSGQFPFTEDSLFNQIEHAQYSFTGPEWSGVSREALHFIRSLMTLRPDQRLSVTDALKHPWITGEALPLRLLGLPRADAAATEGPGGKQPGAATRRKTLTKKPTVASKPHEPAETSDQLVRSSTTFQPLNSNRSSVLFWSYRSSIAGHVSRSESLPDIGCVKEWSSQTSNEYVPSSSSQPELGLSHAGNALAFHCMYVFSL